LAGDNAKNDDFSAQLIDEKTGAVFPVFEN